MASIGSYARFIVGIILAVEVVRLQLTGQMSSGLAFWLAAIFLLLSALWVGMKFFIR